MGRLKSTSRIGKMTINGETFPAVINTAVMIEMEDSGITLDGIMSEETGRWKKLVWLVTTIINTGLRLTGSDERLSEAEVADAIDISDLADITGIYCLFLLCSSAWAPAERSRAFKNKQYMPAWRWSVMRWLIRSSTCPCKTVTSRVINSRGT